MLERDSPVDQPSFTTLWVIVGAARVSVFVVWDTTQL